MSRAAIVLVLVAVLLLGGLALLSRKPAAVPITTIEAPVTAGGDAAGK